MKGVKSYFINIALILLISGISLYFSIGGEFQQVKEAISSANLIWLIYLALHMLSYYLVDAYSLLCFGKVYKKDYNFKQALVNGLSGTLFNGLTPSSSGGQFVQIFVFNNQGIPPTIASSILLLAFISYQTVLISFTLVVMLVHAGYYMHEGLAVTGMAAIGFLVNFIVTAALFLGATSKRFQNFLINTVLLFLAKIHIIKNYEDSCAKIQTYFEEFRKELKLLQSDKRLFFKVCMCNLVKLLIMYSVPFFACLALRIPVRISQYFNFISLASIINLINVFLPIPGASGGSEGSYMILFGFLGQTAASSSMFIWRVFSFYYGLILGLTVFMASKDTKKKTKH